MDELPHHPGEPPQGQPHEQPQQQQQYDLRAPTQEEAAAELQRKFDQLVVDFRNLHARLIRNEEHQATLQEVAGAAAQATLQQRAQGGFQQKIALHKMTRDIQRFDPDAKDLDFLDHTEGVELKLEEWGCEPLTNSMPAKIVLWNSLPQEMQATLSQYHPKHEAELAFADYSNKLASVILGSDSRPMMVAKFHQAHQGNNENIQKFMNRMRALGAKAFTGRAGGDITPYLPVEVYKTHICERLANPEVRALLVEKKCATIHDVSVAAAEATMIVMEKIRLGASQFKTTKGLNRVDNYSGRKTYARGVDAEDHMEVDNIQQQDDGGEYEDAGGEELNQVEGGQRRRLRCWDCNSFQHLRNSRFCPTPGTGRYRDQSRGRGGLGIAGGEKRVFSAQPSGGATRGNGRGGGSAAGGKWQRSPQTSNPNVRGRGRGSGGPWQGWRSSGQLSQLVEEIANNVEHETLCLVAQGEFDDYLCALGEPEDEGGDEVGVVEEVPPFLGETKTTSTTK